MNLTNKQIPISRTGIILERSLDLICKASELSYERDILNLEYGSKEWNEYQKEIDRLNELHHKIAFSVFD